jgi:hypothetical protein
MFRTLRYFGGVFLSILGRLCGSMIPPWKISYFSFILRIGATTVQSRLEDSVWSSLETTIL